MKLPLIKKLDFQYNNLMHSALVSISGSSEEMFVHVQLINSFLRKIFGIEHIRFFNKRGQLELKDAKHPFVTHIATLITLQIELESNENDAPALRVV